MSDLSSAQVIGGSVVTISGDLTPLRANLAQARGMAESASAGIKAVLPVTLDQPDVERKAVQLKAELARHFSQGVIVPVKLVAAPGATGQLVSSGGGLNFGGAFGGKGEGVNPFTERGLGRIMETAVGAFAAVEATRLGASLVAVGQISGRNELDTVIKRETATLKAFEAVPLAGTAVELVAEMAGLTESMQRAQTAMDLQIESGRQLYAAQIEAATKWGPAQTQFAVQMATLKGDKIGAITADTQGKISDEKAQEADFRKAYLKKTEDMIKDQFGTGPSSTMSAIGQVADYANMPRRALLGGFTPPSAMQDWSDKVEQFRAERERQFKAEFAKQFNPNAVSDDTTLGDAQKQIARAQQKAFLIASQGRAVMAKDQAEAFALLQHGDSRAAMLKRQQGERDALAANQKAEYTTFQGSRPERRAMQAEQRAEAKKLNAQQQDELANADRSRTADSISALGAAAASKLRISGQFYKADVAEYKATETAKIATMTDFNAKLAEQMRANAHLADMDAQHSREVARQTAQLQIDASTAVLRAQHRDRAAAIVEFEAQTTAMAKANPENAGTIQAQRAIQEGALKQQQDEQLALESGALRARTQEAGYRARGQSRVAETFAELQRMREEQIKAPAELRSRLAVAQIAELRADQMAVLRPNQYARQADPWHEAYGGPHGNAQAETLQQLKLIADRLKVLVGGQKAAQQDWQINNAFAGMGL